MKKDSTSRLFQLGRLQCDRGDYRSAVEILTEVRQAFLEERRYDEYLEALNLLLRVHAELGEFEPIQRLKESLQDEVIREELQLTSQILYTLGLCASYKGDQDLAQEYLQKSLNLALEKDDKKAICYALNGLAIVHYKQGRVNEALKEIYNLEIFFEFLDLPDLKLSVKFINGHLLRSLGKFEQALEMFWQAYDMVRGTKNLTHYNYLLFALARTYHALGDTNLCQMYLGLSEKSLDKENMVSLSKEVQKFRDSLKVQSDEPIDIRFQLGSNSVIEKDIGPISFKNQFILLDMLRLFLQNPGRVFSKEELADKIWKEPYDPSIHDNKIYVTIKRLRKMIEPDYDQPKYIYRAKNGYYLNRSVRVSLEN